MQQVAWKAYDEASIEFFETYESLSFSKMHRSFFRFLPPKGAMCLDIGAGSGRDAAALARRGYSVTAIEPSKGLRKLAQAAHENPNIRWIDDALPNLSTVVAQRDRYSFILLSAVWMHIPESLRIKSLKVLARLLAPNGYIGLTLRMGSSNHDRIMYPVSVEALIQDAAHAGLKPVYISRANRDSLNRSEVEWRKVVLTSFSTD